MNDYRILGIESNATPKDIRRAYIKLCKLYHPDKITGSSKKYIQIHQAYTNLTTNKHKNNFAEYSRDNTMYNLMKILEKNPEKRLSLKEILEHPYFELYNEQIKKI